jgi:hypothetical protein
MDVLYGVRMTGPLAPFALGLAGELARLGFTELSARCQLALAAHLSQWLAAAGLDTAALTTPVVDAVDTVQHAVEGVPVRAVHQLRNADRLPVRIRDHAAERGRRQDRHAPFVETMTDSVSRLAQRVCRRMPRLGLRSGGSGKSWARRTAHADHDEWHPEPVSWIM